MRKKFTMHPAVYALYLEFKRRNIGQQPKFWEEDWEAKSIELVRASLLEKAAKYDRDQEKRLEPDVQAFIHLANKVNGLDVPPAPISPHFFVRHFGTKPVTTEEDNILQEKPYPGHSFDPATNQRNHIDTWLYQTLRSLPEDGQIYEVVVRPVKRPKADVSTPMVRTAANQYGPNPSGPVKPLDLVVE